MESRRAGKRKEAADRIEPAPTERILTRSAAKKARISPVPPLEKERRRKADKTEEQAVARAPRSRTARRTALPASTAAEGALEPSSPVGKGDAKASEQLQESGMDRETARGSGKAEGADGTGREEVYTPLICAFFVCCAGYNTTWLQRRKCAVWRKGDVLSKLKRRAAALVHQAFYQLASYCCVQEKTGPEAYNRQFATASRSPWLPVAVT